MGFTEARLKAIAYSEITRFLVQVVDPKPEESAFDPACGSGGFLTQAARYLRETYHTSPSLIASCLTGYDIDTLCTTIAQVQMCLTLMVKSPPPPNHQIVLAEVVRINMSEQMKIIIEILKPRLKSYG